MSDPTDAPTPCIPPDPSVSGWWWLENDEKKQMPWCWQASHRRWQTEGSDRNHPEHMAEYGWRILGPVNPNAEVELLLLRMENVRLRAAFRVNMLRLSPASHAEIDAIIDGGTTP